MNKVILNLIKRNRYLRNTLFSIQEGRCKDFLSRIRSHMIAGTSVLDVGSGSCHMTELLQNQGMHTTPLDVANLSFIENITPVIYGGTEIPFANDTFDTAIILTVLHHCSDPEQVLREACRVARKIIIVEDVVRSPLHSMLTKCFDSMLNLEFLGHPHQNKTDNEWCHLFNKLGLRLVEKTDNWSFLVMWQVTYVLERL